MAANSVSYFLKSLNARAKKESEKGFKVFFNATVFTDNRSNKVIEMEPVELMNRQINNFLKTEQPEILKIDLITEGGKLIDGNVCDLRTHNDVQPAHTVPGLGEVEINAIVERRFEEKRRENDFFEMKEIVKELADENDELKAKVEELEAHNQELETNLEQKNQIRYYAGMLGDILESIGIRKEKLSKPIAELMGIDEKEEQKMLPAKDDKSGIVYESTAAPQNSSVPMSSDEQKRFEVISLISQFLNSIDNQLLGELFSIFSEIEANKSLAPELLEYIEKKKEFSS
ncbi:MAG: hypothetical protein A2W93_12135 [Bacteroidetes bacterium GWF2_43_63]|nr:MAG: hypothetical protein A2W94_15625 [Bacteroidetes bacterium GWE2_42_42]OFY56371.1 MAG: hypothetical protein A2W93_12135 [Bacteroidetes bacterium GWF2_43_63]HBG69663.1 hypothetical protein [Bacteroidales bacterium]HCB61930.1 hypothetical protein [Bacteroidales bacterium]HCY42291.1 hypothetical protein [Prolixibacteraceae bacterium]